VSDETIAEIVRRVEQEKMREAQLSAMSIKSAADAQDAGVGDEPQPMAADEPTAVTDEPVQWPGL